MNHGVLHYETDDKEGPRLRCFDVEATKVQFGGVSPFSAAVRPPLCSQYTPETWKKPESTVK